MNKVLQKQKNKEERWKLLLFVVFVLASGVYYTNRVQGGMILLGEERTVSEVEATWQTEKRQLADRLLQGININEATMEELMLLPNVGETTAEKIIAFRQEVGMFQSPEDLMQVSGIGEKTFEELKEYIILE